MNKKLFSLGFVMITSLSLALTGCGSGNNNNNASTATDEPAASAKPDNSGGNAAATTEPAAAGGADISGKITFLTNRTDMIGKEYDEYVKRFNEKYPNIKVEFEASQTDYNQQAKVRMASGELPDVMFIPTIPNSDLPKYFASLDDLGLNDQITFKDFKSYEGKLYGITTGNSTSGIVYNKKAFADAGITEVPKTWDEFLAASEKLKAKGIIPLASNFKDKWPLNNWVYDMPRIIEGKADFPNDKLNSDTPFTMDNGYGKALSLLRELNEKGYLEKDINSTNWEQSKKDIASGKFAMYFLGNWVINQVIDAGTTSDNVGFFPLPYDNSGKPAAALSPDFFYAVSKDSKNIDAAKAFVKWMIEESGYEDFAGFISPLKGKESKLPQLKEFQSTGVQMQEGTPDDAKVTEISNKAQIDIPAIAQEFVLAKDPQKVLDKWNKAWANAKKDLGY
ncbi:ABC transporter substrate-binding protein [Paenibacillus jilunlii]|uniref:ABC transporter substrate-binding protein n=1 Tax=Paenibacillus jilunlii TaxID=682956 RepID=A0A1H0A635_9BACL|nr:extracellular solute-binding protein [Paenibacillus jilunlii]KWX78337.1 ABC transporter substrate-binding protein [Paenibacillus jilunlii]SDN29252.1 ABC-type glycerol-3-phosphate transport system, substrate-binding protein [Paenibacillus jilunlii]